MDLRIFTAIQGREYLTRLFFKHRDYLEEKTGKKLPITAVYSTDEDGELLEEIGNVNGVSGDQFVQTENNPVSEKHNIGMTELIDKTEESHILHLGSDDLCSSEYIERIFREEPDYAGLNGLHFADMVTRKALFYRYYKNNIIGAGRIFSRIILNETIGNRYICKRPYYGFAKGQAYYCPQNVASYLLEKGVIEMDKSEALQCGLWCGMLDRGLDNLSSMTLRQMGFVPEIWESDPERVDIVDIKSHTNITRFEILENQKDVKEMDYDELIDEIAPYFDEE